MGARPRKPAAAKARPRPPASRVPGILALLDEHYPASTCSITHRNSYELLVATVLSAQCTDARVNQVTPVLFARCPTPADLNRIPLADLEQIIKSTGFFRNKAKSLKGAAHRLTTVHGGEVPRTMDELLEIPGVARKTANVVLGT